MWSEKMFLYNVSFLCHEDNQGVYITIYSYIYQMKGITDPIQVGGLVYLLLQLPSQVIFSSKF